MTTLEEANAAVKKIEEETLAKIREKAPELSKLFEKMSVSGGSPTPDNSVTLHTITEDADEDDDAVSQVSSLWGAGGMAQREHSFFSPCSPGFESWLALPII